MRKRAHHRDEAQRDEHGRKIAPERGVRQHANGEREHRGRVDPRAVQADLPVHLIPSVPGGRAAPGLAFFEFGSVDGTRLRRHRAERAERRELFFCHVDIQHTKGMPR